MHNNQYGKPARQKKISSKPVNTVNLGLSMYNVQFGEKEGQKVKSLSESNSFDKSGYASSQNISHFLIGRHRDTSSYGSLGHYPELPTSFSKNKQQSFSSSLPVSQTKSLSPVGMVYEQMARSNDPSKLPKSQVRLPGERVIFAESPSAPGIPIVYRLEEERKSNPDKLNLDRRKLAACPILEGEDNLRLLNFQHNNITKIQHLNMLKKLIFLDLYDNQICEISGLSCLKSLRVLMLGKNRIKKINNLQDVVLLDVLDLHGNKISKMENLCHLNQLRVLNLAGNELKMVKNLTGLTALSELNLRRNQIHTVMEIDQLPSLQRLFLSFNEIESFENIACLAKSTSLVELSLEGNPFCNDSSYKQTILQSIMPLRQLDMKRLSEEEKRIAIVMARKEEEKRKEMERLMSIKEKRRIAIKNAQRQWNRQFKNNPEDESTNTRGDKENSHNARSSSSASGRLSSRSSTRTKSAGEGEHTFCHLAELDGDKLHLYGPGSLDAIDKNWGEKTAQSVISVHFKFINFHDIAPTLRKLHVRFPVLQTLHFELTNIASFNDINAFAVLGKLEHLYVSDEGNPVTMLSLWKPYVIYRLSHLNLKTLNGVEIMDSDVLHAEKTFGELSHLTTTNLSEWRLTTLLALQKEGQQSTGSESKHRQNSNQSRIASTDAISKAGLFYRPPNIGLNESKSGERSMFATNYIREIIQDAIMVERKQASFEKVWPQLLRELVQKYCSEITDYDTYCKQSLEKIKRSVNVV